MVRRGGQWVLEQPVVAEVDDRWATLGPKAEGFQPRKGSFKQQAVLDAVRKGDVLVSELSAEFGAISSVLKSLESKGVVRIEHRRRMRGDSFSAEDASSVFRVDVEKPQLTAEQDAAVQTINEAFDQANGQVVLLDGVTGSGKTEVYLRTLEYVLQQGKNAIVLVPEISLTPQTVARFRGRFGNQVAVMHSRMSQGERFDQWDYISNGGARVVVGARSALFAPVQNLGAIIIDEEHEGSYKQDKQPRYHARDVACWMAKKQGAVVVLGSATPSLEALYGCQHFGWKQVGLTQRANGKPMPQITIVDMAKEFAAGHKSMFSRPLINALRTELAAGHKAVFMLNQRGFAKFLLCRDCGYVPTCDSCSVSLTYHEDVGMLMCHHCGHTEKAPVTCPKCGSPYLKKFGAGTQRVEAELKALLASFGEDAENAQVIRMDADTAKGKGAHQRLLEQFVQAEKGVLLGTQMIAKGLDFDDVTLVGVINADTTLHLPDYRAAERTFDLVEQVAGRAGRADLPGRVVVQTYDASVPALQAAKAYDRALFLEDELPKRQLLGYPPYVRMANILLWGSNLEEVKTAAEQLYQDLFQVMVASHSSNWLLYPATPCALERLAKVYRWHVLITCDLDFDISAVIEPFFRSRKASDTVSVSVDIDPQSLL